MTPEPTLGRAGAQSALAPAGAGAEISYEFIFAFTILGTLIFLFVMACVYVGWTSRTTPRTWWVWGGGVAFPAVVLLALTVWQSLGLRALASIAPDEPPFVIQVTGYQYWWDVVYDPDGVAIRDANEIWLPRGVPVELRLLTNDVIHSFWLPSISPKRDMIPGRDNTLEVRADELGRFRGQCAEFCGLSHPRMAFEAVVVEPDAFAAFLRDLREPRPDPDRPMAALGRDTFVNNGCPACHEVRGVAEGGRLGPDLSRLGMRATIGAGMWRRNVGNLAGWVADVRDMKPGAHMPSYNMLSGPELRAVAHWLNGLGAPEQVAETRP
jgi:cytochrome c oxidase subunit 2